VEIANDEMMARIEHRHLLDLLVEPCDRADGEVKRLLAGPPAGPIWSRIGTEKTPPDGRKSSRFSTSLEKIDLISVLMASPLCQGGRSSATVHVEPVETRSWTARSLLASRA
jgi:hypothetical protein